MNRSLDRLLTLPAALIVAGIWLFDLLLLAISLVILKKADKQKKEAHHVL